jgi:DNA-binding MarR family transcriptional regulator
VDDEREIAEMEQFERTIDPDGAATRAKEGIAAGVLANTPLEGAHAPHQTEEQSAGTAREGAPMERPVGKQLPIGYWLKRVDALLTERSDAALAERGFNRLRWQVLNSIAEAGELRRAGLYADLRPFATPDELDALVTGLVAPGWVAQREDGETIAITEAGQAERERLMQLQQGVRQRAFAGISAEEYSALVAVLQRVARNLK